MGPDVGRVTETVVASPLLVVDQHVPGDGEARELPGVVGVVGHVGVGFLYSLAVGLLDGLPVGARLHPEDTVERLGHVAALA